MKRLRRALGFASLPFFLCACAPSIHYTDESYGYGTVWTYHLFEGAQEDIDDLIRIVSSTSMVCEADSNYDKGIAEINRNGSAIVDDYLLDALKASVSLQEKTNGYFSPFLGGLTDLWLSNLQNNKVPDEGEIAAELARISQTSLSFNGNEVIKNGEANLDLGAIGKGLCLERVKKTLEEKGIARYWVSAGGSSIAFGENPNGKNGFTTVEFEDLPEKSYLAKNESLSVSSCQRQLYEVGGKRYSHIVNPFTGSAEVDIEAVIAFGQDASILDALTTAVYLQGEESAKLYEKEFGIRFIVMKAGNVVYSSDEIDLQG